MLVSLDFTSDLKSSPTDWKEPVVEPKPAVYLACKGTLFQSVLSTRYKGVTGYLMMVGKFFILMNNVFKLSNLLVLVILLEKNFQKRISCSNLSMKAYFQGHAMNFDLNLVYPWLWWFSLHQTIVTDIYHRGNSVHSYQNTYMVEHTLYTETNKNSLFNMWSYKFYTRSWGLKWTFKLNEFLKLHTQT